MTKKANPRHIAIIMDGNGRWAQKRGLPRSLGHQAGIKALKRTVKAAYELGLEHLSVYVFSTENWRRPPEEVSFLMSLLETLITREVKALHKQGVRVRFIGNLSVLSDKMRERISWAEAFTLGNTRMQLNLMLNYGSREELLMAFRLMVQNNEAEQSAASLAKYLYTSDIPDPDLIIRTGGEQRLSNFLLWQAAYAELWFTRQYWPDFNKASLVKAIEDYTGRERRYGGLADEND